MDWAQILTSTGSIGAVAMAAAAWIKTRPALITAETQSEVAIKEVELKGEDALWRRVVALEDKLEAERSECDERIGRMEERHGKDIREIRGQVQILRHERNNIRMALIGLFAAIKRTDDDEMKRIVVLVEEMFERGDRTIAVEKAEMTAGDKETN